MAKLLALSLLLALTPTSPAQQPAEITPVLSITLRPVRQPNELPPDASRCAQAIRARFEPSSKTTCQLRAGLIDVSTPIATTSADTQSDLVGKLQTLIAAGLQPQALRLLTLARDPARELKPGAELEAIVDAHPQQAKLLREFATAAANAAKVESDSDLFTLLDATRAGHLECRLVRSPDDSKEQPTPDPEKDGTIIWTPVRDPFRWALGGRGPEKDAEYRASLINRPVEHFRSRGLIATIQAGRPCVLLGNTRATAMTRRHSSWKVAEVIKSQDQWGKKLVMVLEEKVASDLEALTGKHIQEMLAIIVDGEVYTAPNLNSDVSMVSVEGNLSDAELNSISAAVLHPTDAPLELTSVQLTRSPRK